MKKNYLFVVALFALGCFGAELIPNGDFSAATNGKPANWQLGTAARIVPLNSGKALEIAMSAQQGKLYKSRMSNALGQIKPGKYIFSGKIKAHMSALWTVFKFEPANQAKPVNIWWSIGRFAPADKLGFRKFTVTVTVPNTARSTNVLMEVFTDKKDQKAVIADLKLIPAQQ